MRRLGLIAAISLSLALSAFAQGPGLNCSGGTLSCPQPATSTGVGTGATVTFAILNLGVAPTVADKLSVRTTANLTGITLDGTVNPTITLAGTASSVGFISAITTTSGVINGSLSGDMGIRSVGNLLLSGNNGSTIGMRISTTNVVTIGPGNAPAGYTFMVTGGGTSGIQGRLYAPNLALEGITTNTVCQIASGEITENPAASCTVSSIKYKDLLGEMTCSEANRIVAAMKPVRFRYKGQEKEHYGFIAEDVDKIDTRLVAYDKGQPHSVEYELYTAVLTKYDQCRPELHKNFIEKIIGIF